MGKLIICSAKRAQEPYYFRDTGILVYSIEELCYYISNYLFFVNSDTIHTALFEWIDRELGLKDRAERLAELYEAQVDLKTLITVILCSCDYYTEEEIKSILYRFDGVVNLPPVKREGIRAKNYMLEQNYKLADEIFENMLQSSQMTQLSAKEYGEILHNQTVCKIHLYGLSEVYEGFLEGFIRSGHEESLKQYILALLLLGKEDKLQEQALRFGLDHIFLEKQMDLIADTKKEARENFVEGCKLREYKAEGRMNDFYQCVDALLQNWMQEYRKGK